MIFTLNTQTGDYTINLDTNIKNTYNLSTVVRINNIQVSTSLPYVWTPVKGVTEISLTLTGINGVYNEKRCFFEDKDLYCKIVNYVSQLTGDNKYYNNIPYLYTLLQLSFNNEASLCNCQCDTLKGIYNDILDEVDAKSNCC